MIYLCAFTFVVRMDLVKRITNDAVRKIGISIVLFMHDIDT